MQRVLITGCSTGIGRASAIEFHKRGFEVIATARKPEALDDLDVAEKHALDVTVDASVESVVEAVGRVDVLVNNAGIGMHAPVEKGPLQDFQRVLDTNVVGAARMIQSFAPQMRDRRNGVIVNVSSMGGRVGAPLEGFYSASKFALEGMSESLHYEMAHFGVRVVIIEPGGFESHFGNNRFVSGIDDAPYDELEQLWETSLTRLQGPSDTAPGPEAVAQTIVDAAEGKDKRLRWPVGDDAALVLSVRSSMDDEQFESTMRETLGFNW